ncbi:MAG TPA: DUF3048 domain-containing protein [Beutenbergiaceae bacterium]|nr:DUF3048 domain-containing protein [Beutenbergiaceae bacterium]
MIAPHGGRAKLGALATLSVAAVLLAAGCGGAEEPPPEPEVVAHTPEMSTDKGHAPDPQAPEAWPLSGVPGEVEERPALSVKVENSDDARPQTGLGDADIVWEQLIEGGETRLNAVFHSQVPPSLGPIRSLRPMDVNISSGHGGVLAFSGGQSAFVAEARESSLHLVTHDAGGPGFTRNPDRPAPHNLYGDPAAFLEDGSGQGPPGEFFSYALPNQEPSAVATGEPASNLQVQFPSAAPGWDWDEGAEVWQRTEDGEPAMTTDDGQISAVNVVVLRVQVRNTSFTDPSGAPVPETAITGSGTAVVATGGHTITGTWSKEDPADPVVLSTGDDEDLLLAPGNTWVELLPESGSSLSVD